MFFTRTLHSPQTRFLSRSGQVSSSPHPVPAAPEVPETPIFPDVPETPMLPEVPDTPMLPDVPETPTLPPDTPKLPLATAPHSQMASEV